MDAATSEVDGGPCRPARRQPGRPRLLDLQPELDPGRGHRGDGHVHDAARGRRRDLAARRRHRRHEHHAGDGHRAHPRDRDPQGHRRAARPTSSASSCSRPCCCRCSAACSASASAWSVGSLKIGTFQPVVAPYSVVVAFARSWRSGCSSASTPPTAPPHCARSTRCATSEPAELDPFGAEWDRPQWTNRLTRVLVAAVVAALAFAGGLLIERQYDTTLLTTARGTARPAGGGLAVAGLGGGRSGAGRAANASGSGAGGSSGPAAAGSASGGASGGAGDGGGSGGASGAGGGAAGSGGAGGRAAGRPDRAQARAAGRPDRAQARAAGRPDRAQARAAGTRRSPSAPSPPSTPTG